MKYLFAFLFTLICVLSQAQLRRTSPPVQIAKVVRIIDGDTFEVIHNFQKTIWRTNGYDAPELKQPFGQQAADSVSKFVYNRIIRAFVIEKDLFQRNIVIISHISNKPCNLDSLIIRNGWAWSRKGWRGKDYNPLQDPNQQRAITEHKGLWQCSNPILPNLWRRMNAQTKIISNTCN